MLSLLTASGPLHGARIACTTPGKNVIRYIFGGVNTRTELIIHGIAPHKTATVFVQFLEYFNSPTPAPAGSTSYYSIHKAPVIQRYLRQFGGRIVLRFRLPYWPVDNPIERLW